MLVGMGDMIDIFRGDSDYRYMFQINSICICICIFQMIYIVSFICICFKFDPWKKDTKEAISQAVSS